MSNLKLAAGIMVIILLTGFINLQAAQILVLGVKEISLKNPEGRPFFYKPSTILFDHQELYIAESGESRIQVYSPDGQLKRSIGGKGRGPAEFDTLIGLDLFEDQIYAADSFNSMIKIFDKNGKYLGGFKTPFNPVNVVVLNKEKILVTNRPSPRVDSEKLVYCYNSKGQLQWKAIDSSPAQDRIFYTLINEILLKKDDAGYFYLIWKYQNKYILKIDRNGQIIEKIMLDSRYPFKWVDLPLKNGRQPITSVCWNCARDDNKFYFIAPAYTEDGDIGPGKEVLVVNEKGQISGIIKFPHALRLLTINGQFVYGIDTEDELHLYQLEGR